MLQSTPLECAVEQPDRLDWYNSRKVKRLGIQYLSRIKYLKTHTQKHTKFLRSQPWDLTLHGYCNFTSPSEAFFNISHLLLLLRSSSCDRSIGCTPRYVAELSLKLVPRSISPVPACEQAQIKQYRW